MIVLGIDPGTSATGYGLVHADGAVLRLVEAGVLRAAPGPPLAHRVRRLCDGLEALLDRARPDAVALEGVFTGRNVRSALTMAHVRGAYLLILARRGLEAAEYSPAEVKKAVTGQGRAAKEQVRAMVCALLRRPSPAGLALDAADALAVAICHAHTASSPARRRTGAR